VIFTGKRILVIEKIQFATGSAQILAASMPVVDGVATFSRSTRKSRCSRSAGHADERGKESLNLLLTRSRTQSSYRL